MAAGLFGAGSTLNIIDAATLALGVSRSTLFQGSENLQAYGRSFASQFFMPIAQNRAAQGQSQYGNYDAAHDEQIPDSSGGVRNPTFVDPTAPAPPSRGDGASSGFSDDSPWRDYAKLFNDILGETITGIREGSGQDVNPADVGLNPITRKEDWFDMQRVGFFLLGLTVIVASVVAIMGPQIYDLLSKGLTEVLKFQGARSLAGGRVNVVSEPKDEPKPPPIIEPEPPQSPPPAPIISDDGGGGFDLADQIRASDQRGSMPAGFRTVSPKPNISDKHKGPKTQLGKDWARIQSRSEKDADIMPEEIPEREPRPTEKAKPQRLLKKHRALGARRKGGPSGPATSSSRRLDNGEKED